MTIFKCSNPHLQVDWVYMHLAPYIAYEQGSDEWITTDLLKGYSEADWLIMELSQSDETPARYGRVEKDKHVTWNSLDSSLVATNKGRTYGLVTLKEKSGTLEAGERVWMLVDNDNIKPVSREKPSWWSPMLPPNKEKIQFDQVVSVSKPYAIKAGDSVGHLGYFQAPKEGWHEARYQVHIECFSMDENLPKFLTNPEKVGQDKPLYLKYSLGLALYQKDVQSGSFTDSGKVTQGEEILLLSKVPLEPKNPPAGQAQYYQIKEGYLLKSETSPERLSQYDLAKLGFGIVEADPESFDHLDGETQPKGLVESIYQMMLDTAKKDTRPGYSLVAHNYQRLLDKIDLNHDGKYSPEEYRRAIHNPDYRDELYKMIVKHPSDWYYKKDDNIWQEFLNKLTKDAPEWKEYGKDFIDKMAWMQDVTTEKLGPSLWHMHPLMFLWAIDQQQRYIIKYTHYDYSLENILNRQMSISGSAAPKWGISRSATRTETLRALDPTSLNTNINMLQTLEIDKPMGISIDTLNEFLKGKGSLEGMASAFIQAAQEYNINECYLAAHAAIETGNGRSILGRGTSFAPRNQEPRVVYNMYGIAAVDGNAVGGGKAAAYSRGWFPPELAIKGGAKWISEKFVNKKQNTLYKMRWNPSSPTSHQYATAVNWPSHIASRMFEICGDYHDTEVELIFDFPVYKD